MQTNELKSRHGVAASLNACMPYFTVSSARFLKFAVCGLVLLALLATSTQAAQTVRIVAHPIGVTVPLNFTGSAVITNVIHIGGGSNAVNLSVSGLPSGVTPSFDNSSFTADATNYLTLNFSSGPPPQGIYNVSIDASGGATGNVYILLQVGDMWNGSYQVSGNWSDASSWVGGHVPGLSDDVMFTDLGAQTNQFTNSLVNGNYTIGSLRFSNVTNQYHILQIPAGNTLSVLGTNGFSFLRNDIGTNVANSDVEVDFVGGGNLVVSNQNANFALLIENQTDNTLDMGTLANFTAYVNRMGLGDYSLYPNYLNYETNQYPNDAPRRLIPTIYLARTNIVKVLYTDPNGFTNLTERDYGICFDNSHEVGTTVHRAFNLGFSNVFYADSICINHGNEGGYFQFNPGFARSTNIVGSVTNFITNSLYAVFRNTNGGRMSMFAIGDDLTPNSEANSNIKGYADFSGGSVDMLVDQIYVCRDPYNIASNQTPNVQGQFYMSQGIVDANSLYLGYQQFTNRYTNSPQEFRGYCEATLVVSNTANFIVHGAVTLGYTADTDVNADPGQNFGRITVGPGGTLSANQIIVDGGANLSSGNTITINSGGNLIVSNTIASSVKALDTLAMNSGALTLSVDGNSSSSYVYVTNFNTSSVLGAPMINIGNIVNFHPPSQTIHLIQYNAGTPLVVAGSLPSGYYGSMIVNPAPGTVDLYVSTTPPKTLEWHGYVNSSWDTTTKNWLDLSSGLQTNFSSLDNVLFDDASGAPTNINLAVTGLTPGLITVSNNTHTIVISGSGTIVGSAQTTKNGTGALDVEAGNTTMSVTVNQGKLIGSGTIMSAIVNSGGTMLYSGTINANVICGGAGTSSGLIRGGVDVQPSGVFTNLNNIGGPLTLETGSFMRNAGNVIYAIGYSSTIASNAFLLNLGRINGDTMQVNGTLEDDSGSSSLGFQMTQLTIASGGQFIPGGPSTGSTYVKSNGNGTTAGRLTLATGSSTVIKLNPGGPANTMVWAAYLDYGPSQSMQDQNGGSLLISNTTAIPFAAGQVFNVFGNSIANLDNPNPTGASTNSYPIMVPSKPGPGLVWDLSRLWPGGYIGVITNPVVKLTNSFAIIGGTNIVGTFTWSTNAFQHWVLETQQNPLNVGLTTSNWTRIAGSWTNTAADLAAGFQTRVITNDFKGTNPAVFFRLVFP